MQQIKPPIEGLTIKPFQLEEIDMLSKFDTMAFSERNAPSDHAWSPPPDELEQAYNKGDILKGIYTQAGELIAYYWLILHKQAIEVKAVVVHPNYRSIQLGTYLLKLAEEEGIDRGFLDFNLVVEPFNGHAIHTYLKNGYRITSYKEAYFGKEYPHTKRFYMEKNLSQSPLASILEEKLIACNEPEKLKDAFRERFVGVELVRSADGNSKHNLIKVVK